MRHWLLVIVLLLFVSVREAHAYLDPGSGSMVLQVILGGIAGLMLAVKLFWGRILAFFGVRSSKEEESTEDPKP